MKAIILAAGTGRRLAEMGWTKPKCLVPIGSPTSLVEGPRTLLDRALAAFHRAGISEIAIIVGYQQDLVIHAAREANLKSQISDLGSEISHHKSQFPNLKFISNPHFATTNTLYSLWLAREYLCGDTILLNSDLLFDSRILELLVRGESSALAIDVHPCGLEEVKVLTDDAGRITQLGKDVPIEDSRGEYVGLGRLNAAASLAMRKVLEQKMNSPTSQNRSNSSVAQVYEVACIFYESALNDILSNHAVVAAPTGDLVAIEIDTPEDYERALRLSHRIGIDN